MSRRTPNPAKAQIRDQVAEKIAALSTEEKKRQSKIVYDKVSYLFFILSYEHFLMQNI